MLVAMPSSKTLSRTLSAAIVLSTVLGSGACAPIEDSQLLADPPAAAAPPPSIYILLGNTPNKNDADAFRLIAHAAEGKELDPESIEFCFERIAPCQNPATPNVIRVKGRAATASDEGKTKEYTIFVSVNFVKVAHDLRVTILAKDKAGAPVVEGATIVTKGKQPTLTAAPTGPTTPGVTPATPAPAAGQCLETDETTCKVELEITRLTNELRRKEGKTRDLVYDPKVSFISRKWSCAQAARGSIGHDWIQSGQWHTEYKTKFGEEDHVSSENVAQGMADGDPTAIAKELVDMWTASTEGHHENMVADHTFIGAGWCKGSGGSYGTQNFGSK